ncbi:N-acetyltransferase [Oscillospiraceae bacterium HV4-5-C5C]|nr:N-acetyltransferase [Oscillospiraceae bacterium HV4-5-C5C]
MDFQYQEGRIFALDQAGQLLAEVTFPARDGIATIDHTYVSETLRGQGVAGRLVQAAVDQIRQRGLRPAATCSYAQLWLKRHPEYTDRSGSDQDDA